MTVADLRMYVVDQLASAAHGDGIPLLVVGAVARDLLIHQALGRTPDRVTDDVDIAVGVPTWDAFHRLTARWDAIPGYPHRFRVLQTDVDIVPFDGVELPDRTILWPNHHAMTVVGFAEAFATAVQVEMPSGRSVGVASLPSQVVLKLLAWRDRRHRTTKDALDLRSIVTTYSQGPYADDLFDHHYAHVERHDYDLELAGAELIGTHAATTLDEGALAVVRDLVATQCRKDASLPADMGGPIERNRQILAALAIGLG